jgi:hypothetical protein
VQGTAPEVFYEDIDIAVISTGGGGGFHKGAGAGDIIGGDLFGTADGYSASSATGGDSLALGSGSVANGSEAIAIGNNATATGPQAQAEGEAATAFGNQAMAYGNSAIAGDGSLLVTDPKNNQPLALGNSASSYGNQGMAVGNSASSTSNQGTAVGNSAAAGSGFQASHADDTVEATALGNSATASGDRDTVLGALAFTRVGSADNTIVGAESFARKSPNNPVQRSTVVGSQASTTDDEGLAIGAGTTAGYHATAVGTAATAANDYTTVVGRGSFAQGTGSVAVGEAAVATSPSGAAGDNTAIGQRTQAGSTNADNPSEADASHATAIGNSANARAPYSTAVGQAAQVPGNSDPTLQASNASAFGAGSFADHANATALGANSSATGLRSLAVGEGASTSTDDHGVVKIDQLEVVPSSPTGKATTLKLRESTNGDAHVIGVTETAITFDGVAVGGGGGGGGTGELTYTIQDIRTGNLAVAASAFPPGLRVPENGNAIAFVARLGTVPTGSDVTIKAERWNDGGYQNDIATLTIPAGTTLASVSGLAVAVAKGDIVHFNITQVGSTTPGADLNVSLDLTTLADLVTGGFSPGIGSDSMQGVVANAASGAATAVGNAALAIGPGAVAGDNTLASPGTNYNNFDTTAIGAGAVAKGQGAEVYGAYASAIGFQSLAVGDSSFAGDANLPATSVGNGHIPQRGEVGFENAQNVALGAGAMSSSNLATAVGSNANAQAEWAVAVGGASAAVLHATAVGTGAGANGSRTVAIGAGAQASTNDHGVIQVDSLEVVPSSGTGAVPSHLVLRSPNGTRYQISVSDTGVLSTSVAP